MSEHDSDHDCQNRQFPSPIPQMMRDCIRFREEPNAVDVPCTNHKQIGQ